MIDMLRLARAISRTTGARVFLLKKTALVFLLLASPALAQVSTDDKALDQLAPAQTAKPAQPTPAPGSTTRRHPTHTGKPAAPRLTAPRMPASPPLNPVILPPTFIMPAHAPPPPPPVPVVANAIGVALLSPGAGRITFGSGSSDLNPATFAAIGTVAKQALASPGAIVDVIAWAPGTADDPSSARRLSLDRALAVRAVMIHDGMLSDRIRAVAKGTIDIGKGPPDRAEFTIAVAGKK